MTPMTQPARRLAPPAALRTRLLPALALGLLVCYGAHAEKADREKPVNLEADKVTVDDAKKLHIFEGNVHLTQGTLTILADKLVVSQDAEGFQKGIATSYNGRLARFRQKQEGKDEWVDGEAERIEHNARTEQTDLYEQAWVRSGRDEVRGKHITYDALTEQYQVTSGGGKNAPNGGRVTAIIQPKNKGAAPAPAPAGKP